MKVGGGIFLIIMGGVMLIKPHLMWKVGESWKTKTNVEPSDLYIVIVRIAGLILVIGGIIAVLIK